MPQNIRKHEHGSKPTFNLRCMSTAIFRNKVAKSFCQSWIREHKENLVITDKPMSENKMSENATRINLIHNPLDLLLTA